MLRQEIGKSLLRDFNLQTRERSYHKRQAGFRARSGYFGSSKGRMVLQGRAGVKAQEKRVTYLELNPFLLERFCTVPFTKCVDSIDTSCAHAGKSWEPSRRKSFTRTEKRWETLGKPTKTWETDEATKLWKVTRSATIES